MNIKQLKSSVQETSEARIEKRRHQSEELFNKGKILLTQAHEEGFSNKNTLKQAADFLIDSIQKNRRNQNPYIAFAYLNYLLGDIEAAVIYLKELLSFAPENEEGQKLLEQVLSPPKATKQQSALNSLEATDEDVDYDALYDKVEEAIYQEVQRLSKEQANKYKPTIKSEDYQNIKEHFNAIVHTHKIIEKQLTVIDEEIDISELRQLMRPINIYLKRYNQVLRTSKESMSIYREINKERITVRQFREQIEKVTDSETVKKFGGKVEQMLDHCDLIADRLDEMAHKGSLIKDLEKHYEHLVEATNQLLELIDDISAEF